MVFGKKKKQQEKQITPDQLVDIPDEDMYEEEEDNEEQQQPIKVPVQQQYPQYYNQPVPQHSRVLPMEIPKIRQNPAKESIGKIRILSGQLVDINGEIYHKYVVLSNKSIGEIGEEFDI